MEEALFDEIFDTCFQKLKHYIPHSTKKFQPSGVENLIKDIIVNAIYDTNDVMVIEHKKELEALRKHSLKTIKAITEIAL